MIHTRQPCSLERVDSGMIFNEEGGRCKNKTVTLAVKSLSAFFAQRVRRHHA